MNFSSLFFLFLLLPLMTQCSQDPWNLRPFPVPYLGRGYDLRAGNPEGKSLFTNEPDPGLKPTRWIIWYQTDCPFCESRQEFVDDLWIKEYLADDLIKYRQQIQDRYNLDIEESNSAPCDEQKKPFTVPGGSCKALNKAKELLTVKKSVMVTKEISHIYANARILMDKFTKLIPEFKEILCSLPKNFTHETRMEFFNFFKIW